MEEAIAMRHYLAGMAVLALLAGGAEARAQEPDLHAVAVARAGNPFADWRRTDSHSWERNGPDALSARWERGRAPKPNWQRLAAR
jgi:hypothetical protein